MLSAGYLWRCPRYGWTKWQSVLRVCSLFWGREAFPVVANSRPGWLNSGLPASASKVLE